MTTATEIVVGASVSHSRADVAAIEAACADSQRAAVGGLLEAPAVSEAFVLQTCNRAEAYVVAAEETGGRETLSDHFAAVDDDVIRELGHEASLRHLMRVACGLDSLVLGEDQVIGQVRAAYEDARAAGGIGPTLDDAVLKALHVGERAREETAINEGAVSLGSAAVRLLRAERSLEGATALVVGAGEIARLAARSVAAAADRVIVANRTVPHVDRLQLGGVRRDVPRPGEVDDERLAGGLEGATVEDVVVARRGGDHDVGRLEGRRDGVEPDRRAVD